MKEEPNCHKRMCMWYEGFVKDDDQRLPVCAAYPEGIPVEIAYGNVQHMTVRDDQDNEITYEKAED